ncbi:cytochrome P450 [Deinococcus humi]|uniref:Fatty-acid peroxygenase n=1 Tax=Deinococcus humi TaxID=662880 RepID=A0A7W8JZ11_9DEIO|nr:cytochrome P450 [Deinococcus humi]MBB5364376.1 fatty-acid peroxygenase [Deinococcus humi]GGO33368.1 fatty-acid peroxygenase [Deinococcus humi]
MTIHSRFGDSTLAFLRDGYAFILRRSERAQADVFQTRLLMLPVTCLHGEQAAQLFYDQERFERRGAAPARAQKTLLGEGGVQGLDDEAHRVRKQMFMSLMTPERLRDLTNLTTTQWHASVVKWETQTQVVLLDEVQDLLCRAVCRWAGVPLHGGEVALRTADFAAMIDSAGAVGVRHWRGRLGRARAERWAARLIAQVRAGTLTPDQASALHVIAHHQDVSGALLDERVAAVELLNVLRPTVAVALYVVFAALALHDFPEAARRLAEGGQTARKHFVQEVRRFYPFFPFAAAKVRQDFEWHGHKFTRGQRTLLDLYGTNHDRRFWGDPETFRPERFRHWNGSPYTLIPQGGGDHFQGHRCAGEWITIDLVQNALHFLTDELEYTVPVQNLRMSLRRFPARPASRLVLSQVRRRARAAG